MKEDTRVNVAICGGGLFGLALARQLRMQRGDLSIIVLERLTRPLPEAAFKVGESTTEQAAFYFSEVLGLKEYLDDQQLEKLGLRYFYGDSHGDFCKRPEFGVKTWLPAKSYQLDRGLLENHLRQLVAEAGVELREGVRVQDIVINPGDRPHQVIYKDADGTIQSLYADWIVDAMGRRRFLQQKFELAEADSHPRNSAWFRVKGRLDVAEFVPETAPGWHASVAHSRWYSTNHLMGQGYWVWLIPLASGNTSVGIVALDRMHRYDQYNSYEKAVRWLQAHEPALAKSLADREILDFKILRKYSYSSRQVYSLDRWCCVGEAGVFADPYYSVASNLYGYGNGFATEIIDRYFRRELTQEYVEYANLFFLSLNNSLTETIQLAYPFLNNAPIMALKTIWDYYMGWSITDPRFYHGIYLDPGKNQELSRWMYPAFATHQALMDLFQDWAQRPSSLTFDFIDYIQDIPTLTRQYIRNLPPRNENFDAIIDSLREAIDRMEEFAQVVFFMAVEDTMPEQLALFNGKRWINTAAISLDSDRWIEDGLFEPETEPRPLDSMEAEIRSLFTFKQAAKAMVGR